MWADTETDTDFLNYSEIAELIVELIKDKSLLPLSLGVFGGWGMGKSSMLNLVESELAGEDYLIVRFDAWLYQDFDDARAALMSVISTTLAAKAPLAMKKKALSLIGRVNKLRLLGLAVEGGAALMGFPTLGAASKAIEAGGKLIEGQASDADISAITDGATELKSTTEGLLRPVGEQEPTQEIAAFRKEFGEVLNGLGKTLVVFIDNLDRCLPPNTIHTLEAIRLFLFLPNTAFVIAADEDMVRHAVAKHFKDPGEKHVTDYLDKLIQMPVFVPRPGVLEVRAYVTLLLVSRFVDDAAKLDELRQFLIEQLQQSWREDKTYEVGDVLRLLDREADEYLRQQLEVGLRIAPMLAHSDRVNGNPRIIKRLMNVVRMRRSIASKRGMDLDDGVIAKLALFERCTDGQATETLHHVINAAGNGKPELLATLEAATSGEALRAACPESWKKHVNVIQDWVRLEPKLAGIDLRPAVYLARETVPLRIGASGLSAPAKNAVRELLTTPTLSSNAARDAAEAIAPAERVAAMEELVAEMRKSPEWSRNRADFRGAVVLARASNEAAAVFNRFLRAIPKRPKWMTPILDDETWVELD